MPSNYWVDAAVFLINRMPIRTLRSTSPWQTLLNSSLYILISVSLVVRAILVSAHTPLINLNPEKRSVFLGYSLDHKGYRCLDVAIGRVFLSRHVIFYEGSFPFQSFSWPTSPSPRQGDS